MSFKYYETDNYCYDINSSFNIVEGSFSTLNQLTTDICINQFISGNFIQSTENIISAQSKPNRSLVSNCEDRAIANNKSMFLITDLSYNSSNNNLTYKCLLPKINICSNDTINNLIQPYNELINNLLGVNDPANINSRVSRRVIDKTNNIDISSSFIEEAENLDVDTAI